MEMAAKMPKAHRSKTEIFICRPDFLRSGLARRNHHHADCDASCEVSSIIAAEATIAEMNKQGYRRYQNVRYLEPTHWPLKATLRFLPALSIPENRDK